MPSPLAGGELDDYRAEADRFIAALDEEYYLHFAGLKDTLELAPIYERYSDLTSLDACRRLGEAADGGARTATELWRFGCEGYLGNLTRTETEEIAQLEASLFADVDGEMIRFRMLRPTLANEPDRGRRERLERARSELMAKHLNDVYERAAETRGEGTAGLGASSYADLYGRFGFALDELAEQCRGFLEETEDLHAERFDALLRRKLGITLDDAARWDVPWLFRASEWDAGFPARAMLPALEGTLGELGIDLRAQRNVELDVERRPNKSPRAFCSPIEVPGRIVLVIQPIGGPDDWHALFHEAGHTEHFAHTAQALPLEARRLGDNAVTEGWATLLEHLVSDPVWLSRRLDFGRPHEFAAESATKLLYVVRRHCAKLLYELELQRGRPLEEMPDRYVELLADAVKIEPASADYLADVDDGFYVASYLRSWGFEAQIRAFLCAEYGRAWFTREDAGSLLRELWYEGQSMTADEILHDVASSALELGAVTATIEEMS
jgi:hypothetical protein